MQEGERLLYIVKQKGITVREFCKRANVSESTFSMAVKRNKVSKDLMASMLNVFPDIDARWLLTGKGYFSTATNDNMVNEEKSQYCTDQSNIIAKLTNYIDKLEKELESCKHGCSEKDKPLEDTG